MTSFNQYTAVPSTRMPILRGALAVLLAACNTDAQTGTGTAELAAERETLMALERKWSDLYGRGDVQLVRVPDPDPNDWDQNVYEPVVLQDTVQRPGRLQGLRRH